MSNFNLLPYVSGKSKNWNLVKKFLPKEKLNVFIDLACGNGNIILNAMNENVASDYFLNDKNKQLIDFFYYLAFPRTDFIPTRPKNFKEMKKQQFDYKLTPFNLFYDCNKRNISEKTFKKYFNENKWEQLYATVNILFRNQVTFSHLDWREFNLEFIKKYKSLRNVFIFIDLDNIICTESKLINWYFFYQEFSKYIDGLNESGIKFLLLVDNEPFIKSWFNDYTFRFKDILDDKVYISNY